METLKPLHYQVYMRGVGAGNLACMSVPCVCVNHLGGQILPWNLTPEAEFRHHAQGLWVDVSATLLWLDGLMTDNASWPATARPWNGNPSQLGSNYLGKVFQ